MPNNVPMLVSAAQIPADTVVMVSASNALQTAAWISMIVVGVFFLLLLPVLFLLFLQLRRVNRTVREIGEKGLQRADPLIDSGKAALDNVEFISMAVRTDVERLTTSVRALSDRLQQASDRMEERIAEFNALMEVMQSEAEDLFVGTASTVRGVRVGAGRLAGARDEEQERLDLPEVSRLGSSGETFVSGPETGR
jgi:hypothetical protein